MRRGRRANPSHGLRYPVEVLPEERIHVGVAARDADGGVRRTSEKNRHVRALYGFHGREGIADAVIGALVVEGNGARPRLLHDVEVFARPRIAILFGEKVAVARLFRIRPAGDDVHGQSSVAKLVERRELPRRERRRDESRAMGQEELESRRPCGRIGRHLEAVGRGAAVSDEDAIEAAVFVGEREGAEVALVDGGAHGSARLGVILRRDETQDLEVGRGDVHRATLSQRNTTGLSLPARPSRRPTRNQRTEVKDYS